MQPTFQVSWDEHALAVAMQMSPAEVREYFTDGRRASFILERRLVTIHPGWQKAPSEGDGFDVMDPMGGKWEVRSVTHNGVYFTPSGQVGKDRTFNEAEFRAKLAAIKGFILADIVNFPDVAFRVVPVANVLRWYEAGLLGKSAKISRNRFLKELAADIRS